MTAVIFIIIGDVLIRTDSLYSISSLYRNYGSRSRQQWKTDTVLITMNRTSIFASTKMCNKPFGSGKVKMMHSNIIGIKSTIDLTAVPSFNGLHWIFKIGLGVLREHA